MKSFKQYTEDLSNDFGKNELVINHEKRKAFEDLGKIILDQSYRTPEVFIKAIEAFSNNVPGWKEAIENYKKTIANIKFNSGLANKDFARPHPEKAIVLQVKN
jgi:hypothetical protein